MAAGAVLNPPPSDPSERLLPRTVAHALILAFLLLLEARLTPPSLPKAYLAQAAEPPAPCSLPNASRNYFDGAALRARGVLLLSDAAGALRFPHSLPDPACPRYIHSLQDEAAGIGHRAHEWLVGLWLALTFNLTLVHQPVNFAPTGRVEHEACDGWDEFLGLRFGENPELGRPLLRKVQLPKINGWGAPTAQVLAKWGPLLTPREPICNVVFEAQADFYPGDVSAIVRPVMTWKFAAAAAARARAGTQIPLRYSPSAVNVAVHFRVGDAQPTAEGALWAEARLALQKLRAAGVKGALHVHLHTEGKVQLSHFGKVSLLGEGEGGGEVEVRQHPDMRANDTLWHFAMADVFVGSHSGFSWLAGLLSPRFFALMQRGAKSVQVGHCPDEGGGGTGCCGEGGGCEAAGVGALEAAARRVAAAEACGNIGEGRGGFSEGWPLEAAGRVVGLHAVTATDGAWEHV